MVLLGNVRQHTAEFCFSWQLTRAVATECISTARNRFIFHQEKKELFKLVEGCLFRIGKLLLHWQGKGREEARSLASKCNELLN
eukprot:c3814_g1_i1 orf=146-397(+)